MKKSLLMLSLLFSTSLFAARTSLYNNTKYKVQGIVRYAVCDDVTKDIEPGAIKRVEKDCCLISVQFKGVSGEIKDSYSAELGGKSTGLSMSCGKDNNFKAKSTGKNLTIERF